MRDLPRRKLGNDEVTSMGFGMMVLSGSYGPVHAFEQRLKFLDEVYTSGCRFWDTADVYGDSEDLIGEWFKRTGKRDEIFLATKVGLVYRPERLVNGDPQYLRDAVKRSMSRLGTDRIDLLYLHRPDPDVPIELSFNALVEFVKAGKVQYLGVSECSAQSVRRAHAIYPITAMQVEYSPFILDVELPSVALVTTARELGIKIVAYSPLGRGILSGAINSPDDLAEGDYRRTMPMYSKENFPNILEVADKLDNIGKKHGATASQVALAWLLAQGDDILPIPGTKQIKYLHENLKAVNVKLTSDQIQEIRQSAEKAGGSTFGNRYSPGEQSVIFGDTPLLK